MVKNNSAPWLISCASFTFLLSRHTPCDNEGGKKVGWSEKLNHGKDTCCWFIKGRTEEEGLTEKKERRS